MKRILSIIALILLIAMMLTACGADKTNQGPDASQTSANGKAETTGPSSSQPGKGGDTTEGKTTSQENMKLVKGDGTSFEGTWETDYDLVVFTLDGNKASGVYYNGTGTIEGTIKGNVLTGTWKESDDDQGELIFTLSEDAKSFTGKWKRPGDTEYSKWDGTRKVFD